MTPYKSSEYKDYTDAKFFTDFKNDSEYENSMAYLKHGSNSLGYTLWERRTNSSPSCPMTDGCVVDDCNADKIYCGSGEPRMECEEGDDTLYMDGSGVDGDKKLLLRVCIDDGYMCPDLFKRDGCSMAP